MAVSSDPPPIVIKSGSFTIDSEDGFEDVSNSNSGGDKRKRTHQYKGNFGSVQTVVINKINKILSQPPFGYSFQDSEGIKIKLWLQKYIESTGKYEQIDNNGEPDILIGLSDSLSDPLKIRLPEGLAKEVKNYHHKRSKKNKLNELRDRTGTARSFRFGRIQILDHSGHLMKYPTDNPVHEADFASEDGDEYYISLWDK
jgi:hypothetical protein